MANAERLLDVLTFLEAHPQRHDQNFWLKKTECGTVGCLAGWACLRNGYVETFTQDGLSSFWAVYRSDDLDKKFHAVSEAAVEVLEITFEEGAWLFDDENTMTDLWCIADELTDGEVSRLLAAREVPA